MTQETRNRIRIAGALALAVGWSLLASCQSASVAADEPGVKTQDDSGSLWSEVKSALLPTTYPVPEGRTLRIRLTHSVSSDGNASGDEFRGSLEEPLLIAGHLLAPKGAEVIGVLQDVEGSKRVKGRAQVVMMLESLKIGDEEYGVDAHPLTIRAAATKKKDAIAIGAGSAVGAIVGAVAGGGDDAAKGAAIGAGAGVGYVLLTKGEEVKLGPGTQLSFTLSDELDLPAYPAD